MALSRKLLATLDSGFRRTASPTGSFTQDFNTLLGCTPGAPDTRPALSAVRTSRAHTGRHERETGAVYRLGGNTAAGSWACCSTYVFAPDAMPVRNGLQQTGVRLRPVSARTKSPMLDRCRASSAPRSAACSRPRCFPHREQRVQGDVRKRSRLRFRTVSDGR
jgi:hypothetical protein